MLSLFRHATRRSVSAARPALVAHYSAEYSPEVNTTQTGTSGMEEMENILGKQAERQQPVDTSPSTLNDRSSREKWKIFKSGLLVKPHDFTYKARFNAPPKYQTRRPQQGPPPSIARHNDVFHQLDLDPVDLSMEAPILSHYVSEMGKIYGRNITFLTSKSQRRLGKAIRRAKMMGIIPILSKSPYYFNYKNKTRKQ